MDKGFDEIFAEASSFCRVWPPSIHATLVIQKPHKRFFSRMKLILHATTPNTSTFRFALGAT